MPSYCLSKGKKKSNESMYLLSPYCWWFLPGSGQKPQSVRRLQELLPGSSDQLLPLGLQLPLLGGDEPRPPSLPRFTPLLPFLQLQARSLPLFRSLKISTSSEMAWPATFHPFYTGSVVFLDLITLSFTSFFPLRAHTFLFTKMGLASYSRCSINVLWNEWKHSSCLTYTIWCTIVHLWGKSF